MTQTAIQSVTHDDRQSHALLSVKDIQGRAEQIRTLMANAMKQGVDYGVVPGCKSPSLFKPGSEKLLMLFRIAVDPIETDLSDGEHIRYRVKVRGIALDGSLVGVGIGECSTAEEKYSYRKAVCDEEFNEADPMRKRVKWSKGQGGAKPYSVKQVRMNPADLANCVTPETLILTHDLQWVPAGDLETGDMLIGVEESPSSEYARRFSVGEATVHGRRVDKIYELIFSDGRTVRCNGEHQWLVKKIGLKGTEWVSAERIYAEMIERKGRPRKWTVMSIGVPWIEDSSKDAGYLSGLLDADGSLGIGAVITTFAQQDNCVLASMKQGLLSRGFGVSVGACKSQEELEKTIHKKQVYNLRVRGGLFEQMRLLGTLRPPRLIERWMKMVDLESRRLEGPGSGTGKPQEIVSIRAIGQGEIVMLSSGCLTYIAQGFVCHNTVLKMAKKRAQIDMCLTALGASDVFQQDLEELTEEILEHVTRADAQHEPIKQPQSKTAAAPTPAATTTPAPKADDLSIAEAGATKDPLDLTATGKIVFVKDNPGKRDGHEFIRYGIKLDNNEWFNTFEGSIGGFAKDAKAKHTQVVIRYRTGDHGNEIVEIVAA